MRTTMVSPPTAQEIRISSNLDEALLELTEDGNDWGDNDPYEDFDHLFKETDMSLGDTNATFEDFGVGDPRDEYEDYVQDEHNPGVWHSAVGTVPAIEGTLGDARTRTICVQPEPLDTEGCPG